jgi:hypothetical protein
MAISVNELGRDTFEPNGLINNNASPLPFTYSFVDSTRTFSIAPSGNEFGFYVEGRKYMKSSSQNIVISNDTGNHAIYFDGDGVLQSILDPTEAQFINVVTKLCIVSYVYWDATLGEALIVADERHGPKMDGTTHAYLHVFFGAQYREGLTPDNMNVGGSGDADIDAQMSVGDGVINDEDIKFNIVDGVYQDLSTIAKIPTFYKEGASGDWRVKRQSYPTWQASTAYAQGDRVLAASGNAATRGLIYEVYLSGDAGTSGGTEPTWQEETGAVSADGGNPVGATTTDNTVTWTCIGTVNSPVLNYRGTQDDADTWLPAWNEFTGGSWQQTLTTNNDYVLLHLYATNNLLAPIIAIQGEAEYGSAGAARIGATEEIAAISLAGLFTPEFVPLYTIIVQVGEGRDNHCKAEFVSTDTGGDYVDWRFQALSQSVQPTDHGALSGLGDDDHTQYAFLDGRSGGQVLYGSTIASGNLVLASTSDSTKGLVTIGSTTDGLKVDETNSLTGITSDQPLLAFYDIDGTDDDINAQILVDLTDTGSGTEDADVTLSQQIAGTLTAWLTADADGDISFGSSRDVSVDGNISVTGNVDGVDVGTDVPLNTTHRTSTGADHTWLDQTVVQSASPFWVGLTINNGGTLNNSGGDNDWRIKGNTDDVLLYTDAGNDRVGIGTSTPATKLEVAGDITASGTQPTITVTPTSTGQAALAVGDGRTGDGIARIDFYSDSSGAPKSYMARQAGANGQLDIYHSGTGVLQYVCWSSSVNYSTAFLTTGISFENGTPAYSLKTTSAGVVINDTGLNTVDFRVEGDTKTHLLFTDGSLDRVGINQNAPDEMLDVDGTIKTTEDLELNPTPSADDDSSGIIATVTVDANATGVGAALHLDSDGNWIEADADSVATMPCQALALETGTGTKKILHMGYLRNDDWNWSVGGLIYVSTTTGALTQTAPSGSGDQVQVVGYATNADRMFFQPSLVLVEVA